MLNVLLPLRGDESFLQRVVQPDKAGQSIRTRDSNGNQAFNVETHTGSSGTDAGVFIPFLLFIHPPSVLPIYLSELARGWWISSQPQGYDAHFMEDFRGTELMLSSPLKSALPL